MTRDRSAERLPLDRRRPALKFWLRPPWFAAIAFLLATLNIALVHWRRRTAQAVPAPRYCFATQPVPHARALDRPRDDCFAD